MTCLATREQRQLLVGADFPWDPHVFCAVLWGSQLVEPFIGGLAVASFTGCTLEIDHERLVEFGNGRFQTLWNESEFEVTQATPNCSKSHC